MGRVGNEGTDSLLALTATRPKAAAREGPKVEEEVEGTAASNVDTGADIRPFAADIERPRRSSALSAAGGGGIHHSLT